MENEKVICYYYYY